MAVSDRVALGRNGLLVSRLALGTAQLGNLYRETTDESARATLARARDLGISYLDTAPHYGLGLSEQRVGGFLSGVDRPSVVVSTKVGRLLRDNPNFAGDLDSEGFAVPALQHRVRDYSSQGTRRSLEESLSRLGTDYVDVAFVHDPDDFEADALEGALPELERMRSEGMISSYGAGMNQSAMLARFIRHSDLDVVMVASRFSLLNQDATRDLFPIALQRGVSVVVAGVFNSGILATENPGGESNYNYAPASPERVEKAKRLSALARDAGFTLPQVAAQFPLVHPAVTVVCLGARTPEQCQRNSDLFAKEVPREFYEDLGVRGEISPDSLG